MKWMILGCFNCFRRAISSEILFLSSIGLLLLSNFVTIWKSLQFYYIPCYFPPCFIVIGFIYCLICSRTKLFVKLITYKQEMTLPNPNKSAFWRLFYDFVLFRFHVVILGKIFIVILFLVRQVSIFLSRVRWYKKYNLLFLLRRAYFYSFLLTH